MTDKALSTFLHEQARCHPLTLPLLALRDHLVKQLPNVCGVLYYGSCMRTGNPFDGLVDLYLLVDNYQCYQKPWLRWANWLLPPNVFYLELPLAEGMVRCKYAVLSRRDFERGCQRWFHSYIWGRFAQPSGILYERDEKTAQWLDHCLQQAVLTFLGRAVPALPSSMTVQELWIKALTLSYQAELRAESAERCEQIYQTYQAYYQQVTELALPHLSLGLISYPDKPDQINTKIARKRHQKACREWRFRQVQGKILSLARLIKALFTFQGGIDYILWKLQRHNPQQTLVVPNHVRQRPLIYGWRWLWRLYRQGFFR